MTEKEILVEVKKMLHTQIRHSADLARMSAENGIYDQAFKESARMDAFELIEHYICRLEAGENMLGCRSNQKKADQEIGS